MMIISFFEYLKYKPPNYGEYVDPQSPVAPKAIKY